VHGRIGDGTNMPTRLHRADIIKDVLGGGTIIAQALATFKAEGRGVLVYLRDGTAGVPVSAVGATAGNAEAQRIETWREIGVGAQILRDLGIRSINLLTSSERTYVGLAGFGIEIASTRAIGG
jgi:3,4-dihydroxy 2-butanone 4-phosphate synthase/GTP cyclohydrolase II